MTAAADESSWVDSASAASHAQLSTLTPRWAPLDFVILIVVLIIALAARYPYLGHGPNYDELWHLGLTTGRGSPIGQIEADRLYLDPPSQTSLVGAPPFWKIWTRMDGVLHPPLYVLTLRLWRDALGEGDAQAVAYSIAWSAVSVGFCFATARLATDRVSATLVTLAMAAARTQIYFAQAIRGYEMLIALGAIALWLMVLMETRGPTRARAVALAAMTLPLMLTHYFAAAAVMTIAVHGFWRSRGHRVAFGATLGACGLLYAICWLPFALQQSHELQLGDMFLHVKDMDAKAEALWVIGAPMRLIVDAVQTLWFGAIVSSIVSVAVIVSLFRGWNRALLPMALWLASSILMIAVLDVTRHTQHALYIRYLAIGSVAVFPLMAAIGRANNRRFNQCVAWALLLIAILVRPPGLMVLGDAPGFAKISKWFSLDGNIAPGEAILIFHCDGPKDYGDNIFLHLSHEPGVFPRPVVKVEAPLSDDLRSRLPRRAWLVVPFPVPGLLSRTFPGVRILDTRSFDEGKLYHIDLRPDVLSPDATSPSQPASQP